MTPRPACDYRVLVSRAWERAEALLYLVSLREALPTVSVPLRRGEAEPTLAVGLLLIEVYDRARYDLSLDYAEEPPEPALTDSSNNPTGTNGNQVAANLLVRFQPGG